MSATRINIFNWSFVKDNDMERTLLDLSEALVAVCRTPVGSLGLRHEDQTGERGKKCKKDKEKKKEEKDETITSPITKWQVRSTTILRY